MLAIRACLEGTGITAAPCLQQVVFGAPGTATKGRKRAGVSAESSEEAESSEAPTATTVHQKTSDDRDRIISVTEGATLFSGLTQTQLESVVDAMFSVRCAAGNAIITEGDRGDNFYIVDTGQYEVTLKKLGPKPVHRYKMGDTFGELALMYNTPRAATVTCCQSGKLWALDGASFRQIVLAHNRAAMDSTAQFLRSVPLLSALTDEQRHAVGSVLIEENYADGEVIVKQGDMADSLFVIKTGTCVAWIAETIANDAMPLHPLGKEVARMGPGGVFGESALSDSSTAVRQASVVAHNDVSMLKLERADFTELLGDLNAIVKQNFNEKVLGSMEMFKALSKTQQAVLVDSLVEERYEEDDDIVVQGEEGNAFYIIVTGSVRVTRMELGADKPLVIKDKLLPGAYFGEMALLQEDGVRMATVSANEAMTVMSLDRSTFQELVGTMNDILIRETERRQRDIERAKRPPMVPDDLEVMTVLGVGTFGRVKMVKHKESNVAYALKCMRKGQMVAMKQVAHVLSEKALLEMCDHPFLLSLVASFQDEKEIYMVFDLVLGGELFSELRKRKSFDVPAARFYAACVASAFTYLHERKIAYRDLKPENLLFDADGYLKVVDFGFAKIITDRTWTLCGTPEYLAPEVIQNKGHNLAVDWWSFGVFVYECLVGRAPFEADDPMEIYRHILESEVLYPFIFPQAAREMIDQLLDRNPVSRLGSLGLGSLDIIEHDFFGELSFAELEGRHIPAPYIPDIKSPFDNSNFDKYDDDDDEEELTEDEKEERRQWEECNKDPTLFKNF